MAGKRKVTVTKRRQPPIRPVGSYYQDDDPNSSDDDDDDVEQDEELEERVAARVKAGLAPVIGNAVSEGFDAVYRKLRDRQDERLEDATAARLSRREHRPNTSPTVSQL
jgi:hypothetical protein